MRSSLELNMIEYKKMKGIVFDIQNYAIYDGPGIRTIVFLKGCPLSCVWCQNPESQGLNPQISYFKEKCAKCGGCVETCPNQALTLTEDGVIRDEKLCTVCGTCVEACPNEVIEIIGKEQTLDEVVELILRDKPFYDNSGGGVTISGGEPTIQTKYLIGLLSSLKEKDVHTAIETCGYFNPDLIDQLINLVDLFLFDIKHIDSDIHFKFTGVKSERILENFMKIHSIVGDNHIFPRIPLIPGVNTDLDSIQKIIDFLKDINYTGPIHLMPYNKLAKTKYEKIGKGNQYRDMGDLTDDLLQNIVSFIESQSYEVVINH